MKRGAKNDQDVMEVKKIKAVKDVDRHQSKKASVQTSMLQEYLQIIR